MLLAFAPLRRLFGSKWSAVVGVLAICFAFAIAFITSGCNEVEVKVLRADPEQSHDVLDAGSANSNEFPDAQLPTELRGDFRHGILRVLGESVVAFRRELALIWGLGVAIMDEACACGLDRVIDSLWRQSEPAFREQMKVQSKAFRDVIDEERRLVTDRCQDRDVRLLSVFAVIHRGRADVGKMRSVVFASQHIPCHELQEELSGKRVARGVSEDAAVLTVVMTDRHSDDENPRDSSKQKSNAKIVELPDNEFRAQVWVTFIAAPCAREFGKSGVNDRQQSDWEIYLKECGFYYSDNAWHPKMRRGSE